jgi:hypothetical protein
MRHFPTIHAALTFHKENPMLLRFSEYFTVEGRGYYRLKSIDGTPLAFRIGEYPSDPA